MEYVNLGIGLFIIVSGFIVKKYPNLIAGYNTMSPECKKKVDIERLSSWIRNSFIVTGFLTIVGYYILRHFELNSLADNTMLITIVGGTIIIAMFAKNYGQSKTE